ncbi:MAG: sugar phosphate isomerase/epimerase family protein [Streptosporangiaceae bacterium]
MTAAANGMRLGLCLAAFGGSDLKEALAEAAEYGSPYPNQACPDQPCPDQPCSDQLCLDLPTDTTLGLVDARRCFSDTSYREEVATVLARGSGEGRRAGAQGQPVTCVSNSRDSQLLLGPHGPHTDPVWPGSAADKRLHAVQCAIGSIRLAELIGCAVVRLLVGCPDFARWLSWWGSDVSWADNVDEFYTQAEPLLRAAREAGVVVALEPHPKQIVYDRASADLLFAAGPQWSDTLALCVDPANLAAIGYDPVEAVRGWQARLVAVHAKDLQTWTASGPPSGHGWNRYGPGPPIRFRALGLGALNWPAIVSTLIDEGFGNVLYVEHEDVLLPRRQGISRGLSLLREFLPRAAAEGRTW